MSTIMWVVNDMKDLVEIKHLYGDNLMGVLSDDLELLKEFGEGDYGDTVEEQNQDVQQPHIDF